jgi:hypothetical protein
MDPIIQLLIANIENLFLDVKTIFIFLLLLYISTFFYYVKTGHDKNLSMDGALSVCLTWIGVLFILWGAIAISIPPPNEVNNITLNTADYTQINILSVYLSNSSNTSESTSYNITNVSEFRVTRPSFDTTQLAPIDEARKKLGSGIFSNGIGLIGLGIALISLGFYYIGNINYKRNQEEIIAHLQKREYILKKYKPYFEKEDIYKIGEMWFLVGMIYLGGVFIFTNEILFNILIIGFLIIITNACVTPNKQPIDAPEYTFEEIIQKINDESNFKKE